MPLGERLAAALPVSVPDAVDERVRERSVVGRAIGKTRVVRSALARDVQLVGAAELAFVPILAAV